MSQCKRTHMETMCTPLWVSGFPACFMSKCVPLVQSRSRLCVCLPMISEPTNNLPQKLLQTLCYYGRPFAPYSFQSTVQTRPSFEHPSSKRHYYHLLQEPKIMRSCGPKINIRTPSTGVIFVQYKQYGRRRKFTFRFEHNDAN